MANGFEIEVPIKVTGEGGGKKLGQEIADSIKKGLDSLGLGKKGRSLGSVGAAEAGIAGGATGLKMLAGIGAILAVLTSIDFLLEPIMALLKATLALLFLPLIPILKPVLQQWGALIKLFVPFIKASMKGWEMFMSGEIFRNLWDAFTQRFNFIWEDLKKAWQILETAGTWLWENVIRPGFEFLAGVGLLLYNEILYPAFEWFNNLGPMIWENILRPAWEWFKNIGVIIWESTLKPAFEWFKDVGIKIWDIIKSPFIWLKDKMSSFFSSIFSAVKSAGKLLGFAQGGIVPGPKGAPQLAVVHGGEEVIPVGGSRAQNISISLSINNPSVRSDMDIKKIANEVSRTLRRQLTGRISA